MNFLRKTFKKLLQFELGCGIIVGVNADGRIFTVFLWVYGKDLLYILITGIKFLLKDRCAFRAYKEVSLWQSAVSVERALFLDRQFPTLIARRTELGSPISARLRLWLTVHPRPLLFALVACAPVRLPEFNLWFSPSTSVAGKYLQIKKQFLTAFLFYRRILWSMEILLSLGSR